MAKITLVLPLEKPPSAQDFYNQKIHHSQRTIMKNAAHAVVRQAVNEYEERHGTIALRFPVHLVYTVYYKDERRRDYENVATKYYTDGLTECGVLPDDCSKYVPDGTTRIRLDRANPRTEITIEEILE